MSRILGSYHSHPLHPRLKSKAPHSRAQDDTTLLQAVVAGEEETAGHVSEVPKDHIQDAGETFALVDVNIVAVNVSVPIDTFTIVADDTGALAAGSLMDCNAVHAGIAGVPAGDAPGVFPIIAPYEKVTDGEAHLSDHGARKQH